MKPLPRTMVLAFVGLAIGANNASADSFVVLVNNSNPITSLSRTDIKRAVTGGIKQWESGAAIQVGIIPGNAPETQYLASLIDMSPSAFLSRIQEQVFKGEMRRPALLHSSTECAAFASSNPSSICVATSAQGIPPGAHVVTVE